MADRFDVDMELNTIFMNQNLSEIPIRAFRGAR